MTESLEVRLIVSSSQMQRHDVIRLYRRACPALVADRLSGEHSSITLRRLTSTDSFRSERRDPESHPLDARLQGCELHRIVTTSSAPQIAPEVIVTSIFTV